jgi:ABC-type sugar transport system substrate-binding protein
MKRMVMILGLLLLALTLVTVNVTAAGKAKDGKLKFGYISKILTHPWFTAESSGIKKFCDEKGIEYLAGDANLDDEKCMQMVDSFIQQGVDALMICATSQGLGPAIAAKCAAAGIPLVTIDDSMADKGGRMLSHVGMPTKEVGIMGGETLAAEAKKRNFFKSGNVVKVILVDATKLTVFHERLVGYAEGLAKNAALKNPGDFFTADTKNTIMDEAVVSVGAVVSANPQVTHWIACGGNDDTAVAAVRVFEELGKKNFLSCGIGGYDLALEELAKGNDQFMTIGLRPDNEGYAAAKMIYANLTSKTPLAPTTYVGGTMVTVKNYKASPFWKE